MWLGPQVALRGGPGVGTKKFGKWKFLAKNLNSSQFNVLRYLQSSPKHLHCLCKLWIDGSISFSTYFNPLKRETLSCYDVLWIDVACCIFSRKKDPLENLFRAMALKYIKHNFRKSKTYIKSEATERSIINFPPAIFPVQTGSECVSETRKSLSSSTSASLLGWLVTSDKDCASFFLLLRRDVLTEKGEKPEDKLHRPPDRFAISRLSAAIQFELWMIRKRLASSL